MHVGLTFDLRDAYLAEGYGEEETAELDQPETIDALAASLVELGHTVDRIGRAKQLVQRLAAGQRWDLVFNICEGLRGIAREAQVPAILDVFGIPYTFSDPLVMSVCLHKGLAKMVVERAGLPTPRWLVIEALDQLARCDLTYPLFAKPLAEGTGKGISQASRLSDPDALHRVCARLLRDFAQPVLIEEYLPGREFTVGLLGSGPHSTVLGTMEVLLRSQAEPGAYSYMNKARSEELVDYRFGGSDDPAVRRAEEVALAAWRALGCRDGGRIDLRADARGAPQFLEANPLAGLHPSHSDLPMLARAEGMSYTTLIGRILDSAHARVKSP